jgi:PAS domain S-box-containing protein
MIPLYRILIVDPVLEQRSRYSHMLQQGARSLLPISTYEVATVDSAIAALAWCQRDQLDCILLSTALPDMTGIEFLQQLQQLDRVNLPVVLLMAAGHEQLVEAAMALGAQDYLDQGTLTPELLGRTVRHAIAHTQLQRQIAQLSALYTQASQPLQVQSQPDSHLHPDRAQPVIAEPAPSNLFATIDDLVLIRDAHGRCQVILTPRANHLLYKSPVEMLGSTLHDVLPVTVADQLLAAIQRALQSGQSTQVEYCLPIAERDVWFDARISPIDDSSIILVAREINRHKQLEVDLYEANQRLQAEQNLFVSGPVIIFKWQAVEGWPVEYVSPNVEGLLGYAVDEWLAGTVHYAEIIWPADLAQVTQEVETHSASGVMHFQHKPYRIVDRSGQVCWIDDYTTILRDQQGRITHYLGYVIDVTDRKQAETDLQQSRALLHAVIDTIPQYIFWKDRNLVYLGCNRNFARAVGMQHPREVIGKTDYDLPWSPDQTAGFRAADAQVMVANQPQLHVIEAVLTADGQQRWADTNKLPLHDWDGHVIGVLGTCEDIIDRRQREEVVQNIALGVSAEIGAAFFQSLVEYLSKALGVEFAFVGEIMLPARDHLRTLAGYGDGQILENFTYAIAGSPCEQALQQDVVIYPANIQHLFPTFQMLADLGIESYVGIPLLDAAGQVQGLIAVLSRRPLVDTQWMAEVLKIFAARAQAELARQLTEAALKHNEERWQLAIQATNDGIFDLDLTTDVTFFSPRWKAMLGYADHEISNHDREWRDRIHPNDYDRIMALNEAVFTQAIPVFLYEYRLRCRDGNYIWVYDRALVVWNDAGQPIRMVGAMTDITARKEVEAEQQRQFQRWQLFTEITLKIRQSLQLEEIWQTTVTEVQRILEADRVTLFELFTNYAGQVVETATAEPCWQLPAVTTVNPCYDDQTLQQYRQGQISRIDDIESANFPASYLEFLREISVRACLIVPILQADQLWGLLITDQCSGPRQWTDFEADLLQQLANQVGIAIQQSQLYQQTRQQAQRAEGLNRVFQVLRQSFDLTTIFETAAHAIGQLLDVERSAIVQYQPEQSCWQHMAVYRKYANMPHADGLRIPDQHNPFADRLKRLEVIRIDDTTIVNDPINQALAEKYPGAWLMVPLVVSGILWGSLSLLKERQVRSWSDDQVELTQTVADQLAIAIQQANLYHQVNQELAERQRAEAALQVLNQELEQRVQQRTEELERSQFNLEQQERKFRTLVENSPDQILRLDRSFRYLYVNPKVINNSGMSQTDIVGKTSREVGFSEELAAQWETTMQTACDTGQEQITTYDITLPTGWQYHESRIAPELSPTGAVESVLVVIRNITALKQAETALRQQVEREQLIAAVTQRIRSSLQLPEILNHTVVELQQALHTDRVVVYRILTDGTRSAIAEATAPQIAPVYDPHHAISVSVPEDDSYYLQGKIYVLNDRNQDLVTLGLAEFLQTLDVQAEVVVPIILTDNRQSSTSLWGLLIVHQCHTPRPWQSWEIELLQQVATQLAIAIQQADLYAQVQAELADRQRAEAELRISLHEQEVLLREVHHRVKNNLQLVSSLLSLQAQSIADPHILAEFQESQRRITAMAKIHEQLYQADHLGKINMSNFIHNLANGLLHSNLAGTSTITLNVEAIDVELGIDIAIPCGLVINELVSNSTKHAFPSGRSGEITIRFLTPSPGNYQLIVQDNGIGIPPTINIDNTNSLGLQIVKDLTEQLGGTLTCGPQGGATFTVTFPSPQGQ